MGIFNNINEKVNKIERQLIRKPPLFLTCYTQDTDGGLFQWKTVNASPGLVQNGNNVRINFNCILIILVDAIKLDKGEAKLQLKNKENVILQSYNAKNNRKNESISINYANEFKINDVIYINSLNVMNIQLTIYGSII